MAQKNSSLSLKELVSNIPENKKCIDCGMGRPQWASTTYGIFLCLNCAGTHRSYGVKISMVKSMTMDVWSDAEKKKMELGGNARFLEYIKNHKLEDLPKNELYTHRKVQEYATSLKKSVEEIFPESKTSVAPSSPKERKSHTTRPSASAYVREHRDTTNVEAQSSYINIYNQTASAVLPTMQSFQTGISEAFGKAAEYFYSASSALSGQISEKLITPVSVIIEEKGSQISSYIKSKDTNRRAISKAADKESREKETTQPPNAEGKKRSFDKWD